MTRMRCCALGVLLLIRASAEAAPPTVRPSSVATPAQRSRCVVIAHRGNSAVHFENTMRAFASAYDVGAGMIEVDVQRTRDGVPVVLHDNQLEWTTAARGLVSNTTLAELKSIKAGSLRDETATDPIPTLEEVLLLARDRQGRVLLDIKVDGMAPAIAAIFARHSLPQEMAAVGTWNDTQATEYLQHLPRAEILNTQGIPPDWGPRYLAAQRERGIDAFELWFEGIPPGFIEAAHAHGLRVYVYTVNQGVDLRRMLAADVDGIETDVPEFLVHILRDHSGAR